MRRRLTAARRFRLLAALALPALVVLAVLVGPARSDELGDEVDTIVTGALGPQSDTERYCANIADAAKDARFAWQARTLAKLEAAMARRAEALEKKRAEYQAWLEMREAFTRAATDNLVRIYSKMRPDAAARQMELLHMSTSAALLMKLNPRISSTILNEMDAAKASGLTRLMVDTGSKPAGRNGT